MFMPKIHHNNPNKKGVYGFTAEEWKPLLVVKLQDGLTKQEKRVYGKAMKDGQLFQAWGWLITFNETGTGIGCHAYDQADAQVPLKRMRHSTNSNNTLYERFVESITWQRNDSPSQMTHGDYSCTTAHHAKINEGGMKR